MAVPKSRENFVRMCLLIEGPIFEMLKCVMEVHISPNRIHAKYETWVNDKNKTHDNAKRPLYRWQQNLLKRFGYVGYEGINLALVFWVLQNLLVSVSAKTFQRNFEDIRHNLNKLYCKRLKGYLSDDDFRSMEGRLLVCCENIEREFPLVEKYVKILKRDMGRDIEPIEHELIVEKFIRSCSTEEGWLLEAASIRGESAYISLHLTAESLPRYNNNRSAVERLNKRLIDWNMGHCVVGIVDPIVYLGGDINRDHISQVLGQSTTSTTGSSVIKTAKRKRTGDSETEEKSTHVKPEIQEAYLSLATPGDHKGQDIVLNADTCLVYFLDHMSCERETQLHISMVEKEVEKSQLLKHTPNLAIVFVIPNAKTVPSESEKHSNIIYKLVKGANDLRIHVMSALEGRMIHDLENLKDVLQADKSAAEKRKRRKICTQVEAILNQFCLGSTIFPLKSTQRREIPPEIEVVLMRYRTNIFLQGFWGNELRIYIDAEEVDKQAFKNIKEQILMASPQNFHWAKIRVVHALRLKPRYFLGQGTKLFRQDPNPPAAGPGCQLIKKESYATLGCFAKSSDNSEVVLTSSHFIHEHCDNRSVYVETGVDGPNQFSEVGHCVSSVTTNQEPYVEVALVKLTDEMKDVPHERRLLDEKGNPKNTELLSHEKSIANLIPIPVFKKGATTGWTEGIIRATAKSDCMKNVVLVESIDDGDFARGGDSGSIIIRHSGDPEDQVLDALAMVLGGVHENVTDPQIRRRTFSSGSTASESGQSTDDEAMEDLNNSVLCSDFAKSLKLIETKHGMKITFFCDNDDDAMQF